MKQWVITLKDEPYSWPDYDCIDWDDDDHISYCIRAETKEEAVKLLTKKMIVEDYYENLCHN